MPVLAPDLSALRSRDVAVSNAAWRVAYDLLWEAGLMIANLRLCGRQFEPDRQDIVKSAITEFTLGFLADENSFNQIRTWSDCLRMTRHIVRLRILDFYRSRGRNRVDSFEELPELPPDFDPGHRFRLDEMLPEIDRLLPNPPVPQVFRARFLEGWSTDEIAERFNLNRNTLLSHFAKGLRTLRECLTRLEGVRP